MKPYRKENIPLARVLRKNMTPWERKLWYEFLRDFPVRFQRQKTIGRYIVDFYCAKAALALELDGGGHYESGQAAQDQQRKKELEQAGVRVLRICNLDVEQNFRAVCEMIEREVKASFPSGFRCSAYQTIMDPMDEIQKRQKESVTPWQS